MTDEHAPQTLSARDLALLDKYDAERAKRIRADGLAQFRRTDGEFAHFLEDPYVEPLNRAPMDDEPDVAELFRQRFRREARQGTYVMHLLPRAKQL